MSSTDPFPPAASSDGRPVCRFCLDDDESDSRLISPCDCRGTVAHVHPTCLETWVEKSKNTVCQTCQIAYEHGPAGLKKFSEWTWPRHLLFLHTSFYIWIGYLLILGISAIVFGYSGMMKWIDYHYVFMYGVCSIDTLIPLPGTVTRIVKKWKLDNTKFEILDTCSWKARINLDRLERQITHCAFCLEGTAIIAPMIKPCRCSKLVVHTKCIERLLGTNRIHALFCGNCRGPIYQVTFGLRKITEWKLPRPLSNTIQHNVEFYMSLFYIVYILRLVRVYYIVTDNNELWPWMYSHIYWAYWGLFSLYFLSNGIVLYVVAVVWYSENTAYTFKNRDTTSVEKGSDSNGR